MTAQPDDQLPELRTVTEAALFLHVSAQQVRRLIAARDLSAYDIGSGLGKSTFRIAQSDLDAFLTKRAHKH